MIKKSFEFKEYEIYPFENSLIKKRLLQLIKTLLSADKIKSAYSVTQFYEIIASKLYQSKKYKLGIEVCHYSHLECDNDPSKIVTLYLFNTNEYIIETELILRYYCDDSDDSDGLESILLIEDLVTPVYYSFRDFDWRWIRFDSEHFRYKYDVISKIEGGFSNELFLFKPKAALDGLPEGAWLDVPITGRINTLLNEKFNYGSKIKNNYSCPGYTYLSDDAVEFTYEYTLKSRKNEEYFHKDKAVFDFKKQKIWK